MTGTDASDTSVEAAGTETGPMKSFDLIYAAIKKRRTMLAIIEHHSERLSCQSEGDKKFC